MNTQTKGSLSYTFEYNVILILFLKSLTTHTGFEYDIDNIQMNIKTYQKTNIYFLCQKTIVHLKNKFFIQDDVDVLSIPFHTFMSYDRYNYSFQDVRIFMKNSGIQKLLATKNTNQKYFCFPTFFAPNCIETIFADHSSN